MLQTKYFLKIILTALLILLPVQLQHGRQTKAKQCKKKLCQIFHNSMCFNY